jgi:hypothetical protein
LAWPENYPFYPTYKNCALPFSEHMWQQHKF